MRTTLDIPADLIDEARKLASTSSKTATVILSLQELIRSRRIRQIRKLRGKLDIDIDIETLRRDRKHGSPRSS